jgi:hypothetical protein
MRLPNPAITIGSMTLLGLAACASNTGKNQPELVFNNPGRIELQVTAKIPSDLPPNIEQEVTKNLTGWNYPVGEKDGEAFSHNMKATVGILTHGSTPAGFSFSIGNSDPRSVEFQKADTLPVSCALTSNDQPEQTRELSMDFIADRSDKAYLAVDKLADHISTVCFNLLAEVKWPLKANELNQSNTSKSPSWMPEIRIEDKVTTDDPISAPVLPPSASPSSTPSTSTETEGKSPTSAEQPHAEKPKVTIQRDKPRRQIIIHNQGAPVILEFGHQRR